jgi:translation initiation factor 6
VTVRRVDFGRIPYIGAFALCTDRVALFPDRFHFKEEVAAVLKVPLVRLNVSRSPLIGILVAGNSKGFVCSDLFELGPKGGSGGFEVKYVPGRFTALGNLILANDYGVLVSPDFPDASVKLIEKQLGVPVERGTIAGFKNVGAVGVATNRGVLLHPDVKEKEVEHVQRVLRVPAGVGTACGGLKFVGLCVIANSHAALAGTPTTGPELGRIESSLGFV